MGNASFSVATSVYKNDNPVFFDRALESITDQQTIKPNEIVLVVDGPVSTEIDSVIDKYSTRYNLKVIRLEENGGLGNALKIATENCSNELIARMDSDDISVSDRFEQQLICFEQNQDIDIVGGNISEFVDNEDNIVGYRTVPTADAEIKKYLKKRCPFNHMSVMFKKSALEKAGGYLEWHYNEDYYLWIRMFLAKVVFSNTGTILVNARVGKEMYSRRGGKKYFKSEKRLQKLMLHERIINRFTYFSNITKRFIVQCLLPNSIRGFIFRKMARSKKSN